MDVVFLGTNNVGREIYRWLCERETVDVRALLTTGEQLDLVRTIEPEMVVAVGYRHIVPPEILSIPDGGCINVHPGLLPYARGFNPNVWSIVEDLPAGVTIHYMDEGIDTGEIVSRKRVPVSFDDSGRDLYERLETACYELFVETWPALEAGRVETIKQDDRHATYHERSDFEELCELDPEAEYTTKELLDRLRALTFPPFGNASIEVDGERYVVEVEITREDELERTESYGAIAPY